MPEHVCGFHFHEGAKLYYEIHGGGEPLILLHGNSEDCRIFDKMLPLLSARYRVILADTRGHGRSDRGCPPLDFFTLAYDVRALMDHLNIQSAHILGFSDGGNTALHLALKYPDSVRSLVLLGANLSPLGLCPIFQTLCILAWGKLLGASLIFPSLRGKYEKLSLMVLHPNLPAKRLRQITAPALVMTGKRDFTVLKHETLRIARYLPDSAFVFLKGAGHFLPTSHPVETSRAVLRFLRHLG